MATTTHIQINHDKDPVRLFRSDFLEFFTDTHPAVVLITWLPVVFIFLFLAIRSHAAGNVMSPWYILLSFPLGLFLWTLTEVLMHRFVFHFRPRTVWQERLSFLFHGVHHYQPQWKIRLVMPPGASIMMANQLSPVRQVADLPMLDESADWPGKASWPLAVSGKPYSHAR